MNDTISAAKDTGMVIQLGENGKIQVSGKRDTTEALAAIDYIKQHREQVMDWLRKPSGRSTPRLAANLDPYLNRPLMRDEADMLEGMAAKSGVTLRWQRMPLTVGAKWTEPTLERQTERN